MIHFLHPNCAWFFLLLIPVIAAFLYKPAPRRQTVPSLIFWKTKKTEKQQTLFIRGCRLPLSFWIISSAMTLLILAAMTPVTISQQDKRESRNFQILRFGPESKPFDRALSSLPNISIVKITEIPAHLSEKEILVITEPLPSQLPEGYIIIPVQKDSIPDFLHEELLSGIKSGPKQEVLRLTYPVSFTKSVLFPQRIAESIGHFTNTESDTLCKKQKSPYCYSVWLIVASALLLLFVRPD